MLLTRALRCFRLAQPSAQDFSCRPVLLQWFTGFIPSGHRSAGHIFAVGGNWPVAIRKLLRYDCEQRIQGVQGAED